MPVPNNREGQGVGPLSMQALGSGCCAQILAYMLTSPGQVAWLSFFVKRDIIVFTSLCNYKKLNDIIPIKSGVVSRKGS